MPTEALGAYGGSPFVSFQQFKLNEIGFARGGVPASFFLVFFLINIYCLVAVLVGALEK